ncbi:MAG: hypothetical protein M1299_11500 [Firmicutes bacterium]|nr:hypothetical protein [Bacillota bacterium]MCL5040425.1 hypothetical protein [Bacillota bacterium]
MKSGFACPHCGNGLTVSPQAGVVLHLVCDQCHNQYDWWEDGIGTAELLLAVPMPDFGRQAIKIAR